METLALGFCIGLLFGGFLYLGGLANPDKIIGTLRFRDGHAFRTLFMFLLVSMLGVWLLSLGGWAHWDVKSTPLLSSLVGGALVGIGFGLTGFCPGTGLACMGAGYVDALVTVVGMLLGALAFIGLQPYIMPPLDVALAYGDVTLPGLTETNPAWWVLPFVLVGAIVLWVIRPRPAGKTAAGAPSGGPSNA